METDRSFNLYSLKTDLSRNIKDWKFNTGIKWSQVSTANDFDFFILNGNIRDQDPSRSNLFDYTENISAVYTETSKEWASWSLQAGLRYEYTNSSGQLSTLDASGDSLVERSYGNLFPNLALSYKKNPMNQWSFNYSRRIERPNYQNLNPFLYQRDELSFSQGNPFLIPQISDNFRIAHLYKYSTSTALSYSYTSDFFAQITDTVGLDRNSMTTRNVADSRSVSLSVGSPIPGNDWWDSYLSLTSFQTWYLPVDPSFEAIDQFTLSLYAQSNFKLPKNYQFQVSGWFSSPGVWGGTYRTESLGSLNASISKTMMNDRLKVFVNFNDILFTSPWQGNMSYGALQIRGNGGNDSRQIEFGLSYRFGNEKVNQLKLEKGGLEDESKRVN
jgi:iron complex outermembrane receptor protein